MVAFQYEADDVPADADLFRDVLFMAECLRKLYDAQDSGQQPGTIPPEALSLTEFASGKPLSRVLSQGQGRGLNAEERKIVERHAMELAKEHLKAMGLKVTDRSRHTHMTLRLKKAVPRLIEVKEPQAGGEHSRDRRRGAGAA